MRTGETFCLTEATARLALTKEELAEQPMAGDLFRVRMNIRGQEEPLFG